MACQPSSTYGLSMEKDYLIALESDYIVNAVKDPTVRKM